MVLCVVVIDKLEFDAQDQIRRGIGVWTYDFYSVDKKNFSLQVFKID